MSVKCQLMDTTFTPKFFEGRWSPEKNASYRNHFRLQHLRGSRQQENLNYAHTEVNRWLASFGEQYVNAQLLQGRLLMSHITPLYHRDWTSRTRLVIYGQLLTCLEFDLHVKSRRGPSPGSYPRLFFLYGTTNWFQSRGSRRGQGRSICAVTGTSFG